MPVTLRCLFSVFLFSPLFGSDATTPSSTPDSQIGETKAQAESPTNPAPSPAEAAVAPPPPPPVDPMLAVNEKIAQARAVMANEKNPSLALSLLRPLLKQTLGKTAYVEIRFLMGEARFSQGLMNLAETNYKMAIAEFRTIQKSQQGVDTRFAVKSYLHWAKITRGTSEKKACDRLDDVRIHVQNLSIEQRQDINFLHKQWHCLP